MLRNRKSSSGLRLSFILTILSGAGTLVATASDDAPVGYKADRYQKVWERNPFTIVTPVAQAVQPKAFDKYFLASWLNDGGRDVVFVQNTETNEVQRITTDPNSNGFRLLAIHKDADPKNAEVLLSNGTEEGTVKFRLETVTPGPPPQAGQQPAIPTPVAQNPIPGAPAAQSPAMSRQAQAALNGQQMGRFGPNQQGTAQSQPEAALPPRASEVRRKRLTPPPVTQQPIGTPTPIQNIPGQPQPQ